MSVSAVVAAGSALALYYVGKRGGVCAGPGQPFETHSNVHSAPTSFLDDLYFLAEGLRYTYGETLARWRTADLLIGLAYLCRKDPEEHPVADIAQLGQPYGRDLTPEQWPAALTELRELERFFRYCSGLRERRPLPQRQYFNRVLDVTDEDLLAQELRAGVLKPSYVLVRDRQLRSIVLAIRGTHSFKDMFTSLTGASKPHHLVDANGVVLGYSHFGMLAAARWMKGQTRALMEQALVENPGYRLRIIGHSLGAGTATLLTMMLREAGGPFAGVTCVAVACPSCMTLELAQSCSDYVTTVIHNADVIPTICPGSADALREEVMRSSWFREFRRDVRATGIVRAVECGIRGVGSATLTATTWTTSKLAACYSRRPFAAGSGGARQRRPQHKRRNSDGSQSLEAVAAEAVAAADAEMAAAAAAEGAIEEAAGRGPPRGGELALPLSSSAPAPSGSFSLLLAAQGGDGGGEEGWQQQQRQQQQQQEPGQQQQSQLQWSSSWGIRTVTSSTSQVLAGTSQVLRSTSGLLRRMWPGAGGGSSASLASGRLGSGALLAEEEGDDKGGAAAAAAAAGGQDASPFVSPRGPHAQAPAAAAASTAAAGLPPSPMSIDADQDEMLLLEEEEEEMELEMEAEEEAAVAAAAGDGDGEGGFSLRFARRRQEARAVQIELERRGCLEEEVNLRMHEVQQAVHDAEEEEAAAGRDDSTVPAVIRPGSYGIPDTPSGSRLSPSKRDPQWRRQMYPAGRILHLVPARLVPGTPAYQQAAAAAAAAAAEAAAAEPAATAAAGQGGQAAAAPAGTAPPSRAKHAAQLSVSDLMAGEGLLNRRISGGDSSSAEEGVQEGAAAAAAAAAAGLAGGASGDGHQGQQQGQPQQGQQQQQQQEEMMLLEGVPQEAYARIRLCRSVLSDHIIPNYLKSLESTLEGIYRQAGIPLPEPRVQPERDPPSSPPSSPQQQQQQQHEAQAGRPQAAADVSPPSQVAATAAALRSAAAKPLPGKVGGAKQD